MYCGGHEDSVNVVISHSGLIMYVMQKPCEREVLEFWKGKFACIGWMTFRVLDTNHYAWQSKEYLMVQS